MAQLSQHEAAELWELARDHMIAGAKFQWMSRQVQDPQLRSTLEQHARRYQQVGQQLESFIGQGGAQAGFNQFSQGQFSSFQGNQNFGHAGSGYGSGSQAAGGQTTGMSHGSTFQGMIQSFDVFAAGECLKECKQAAVNAIQGATEASQPARQFLYQLAGEHLQMADQHYRWLEQRGIYASPKTDQQDINEYNQKLRQIAQAGQQIAHQFAGQAQAYTGANQWGTYTQYTPSYQQHAYSQQHTYSGTGNFSTSEQHRQQ